MHAKSACDVYLSFNDQFYFGVRWNSDDLERINFVKKSGGVGVYNYVIYHKHFARDEKVVLPEARNGQITIFVKPCY